MNKFFIALRGDDGTEYARAELGPLIADSDYTLVNERSVQFPPMTHESGIVTSFAIIKVDVFSVRMLSHESGVTSFTIDRDDFVELFTGTITPRSLSVCRGLLVLMTPGSIRIGDDDAHVIGSPI